MSENSSVKKNRNRNVFLIFGLFVAAVVAVLFLYFRNTAVDVPVTLESGQASVVEVDVIFSGPDGKKEFRYTAGDPFLRGKSILFNQRLFFGECSVVAVLSDGTRRTGHSSGISIQGNQARIDKVCFVVDGDCVRIKVAASDSIHFEL